MAADKDSRQRVLADAQMLNSCYNIATGQITSAAYAFLIDVAAKLTDPAASLSERDRALIDRLVSDFEASFRGSRV